MEDNNACISIANNATSNSKIKHVDVKYHYIRHKVLDGTVKLVKIPTDENIADIFTKPLAKPKFEYFQNALGVRDLLKERE